MKHIGYGKFFDGEPCQILIDDLDGFIRAKPEDQIFAYVGNGPSDRGTYTYPVQTCRDNVTVLAIVPQELLDRIDHNKLEQMLEAM